MVIYRHLIRSFTLVAALALLGTDATAQEPTASVQQLIERGDLAQAVERAEAQRDNPESTYLAAQAFAKMNNEERAAAEYARLREVGDESWQAIGESGTLMAQGDTDGAMTAATRATAVNGDNPYAHYQVGLVASRQNNHGRALEAFGRAAELKPDFAYAHYYAGAASQRLKQIARMSEHWEIFLKLAPDAPERTAVAALLRTLRPRR